MPIYTLRQPFDKLRGSIRDALAPTGLVLYDSAKAAQVCRRYLVPNDPSTPSQDSVRANLGLCAAAFRALSAVQAAAWNLAAGAIQETNALGATYELSGIDLYCRVNCLRLLDGQAQTVTVPPIVSNAAPVLATVKVDASNVVITANTTAIASTLFIMLKWSALLPGTARQARTNEVRIPTTSPAAAIVASTANAAQAITIAHSALRSSLAGTAGQSIGISLQTISAGYYPCSTQFVSNIVIGSI